MLYQLSYTLFTRIHATGLEPVTTALTELEVALQIANLDNNFNSKNVFFLRATWDLNPNLSH